ncbi:LrgB family protein [Gulbenkiania mobilis]|uniref:Murein hydrolase (TIGR00659 family) n=1 Tax=Gulbenkiania mobilis TaxID=397457 RepID=A0ABY2CXV5_GULMO|nr:putative murein hydrolase (TIGR00659 family) [Gulbenkiania mobilis]
MLEFIRTSPLVAIFVTLVAYRAAIAINRHFRGHPLSNPVLVGCLLLLAWLVATGTTFDHYIRGGQFIQMLLGPATVALAVPLYSNLARLKRAALPLALSIGIGGLTGIVSAVGFGAVAGLPHEVLLSLCTRAVTTPIAMGVSQGIGGIPELSAMFVILSGIFGAVIVKPLFGWLRLSDETVLGVSTGIAAHGIGMARVFQISEPAGAFAGLAMGLNGLFTAVVVPLLVGFIHP